MKSRNMMIAGGVVVVILAAVGGYMFLNLQGHSDVEVISQDNLDDASLLSELSQVEEVPEESGSDVEVETEEFEPGVASPQLIRSGDFVHYDPAHTAEGSAEIFETEDGPILKLKDFSTNNGPDLFVYLASESDIPGIKSPRGEVVSLGELKQIKGDQVYKLPENYSDFNSVVIWCRAFDINFSSASLE